MTSQATSRSYRIHGRFFLFTWSQIQIDNTFQPQDNDFDAIATVLQSIGPTLFTSIGFERHQDGGWHIHAAVEYESELDRRLDTQLNCYGRRPNVRNKGRKRQWLDAIDYSQKDGQFRVNGVTSIEGSVQFDLLDTARSALSFAEFTQLCFTRRVPYAYCQATWNFIQTEYLTINAGEDSFGTITNAQLRDRVWRDGDDKCIAIVGPSGVGKTTWARRNIPKPALFVTHLDDLKHFTVGYHKGILFDDISFKHLPITTQISVCDWDNPRSIHCRHTVARIPANVPKIFTCNEAPLDFLDAAVDRRVEQIYLE